MPRIGEMYPAKYLSYKDLPPDEVVYVTITGVVIHQATAQERGLAQPANQYTRAPHQQQNVQTDWLLWFQEFPKPLYLKKSKATKIAGILRCDDTDLWPGRRLGLYRGRWSNGGQGGEGLMIDDRPAPPASTAMVHTTPGGAPKRMAPIPIQHVERFRGILAEQGKSWDDFQMWLKRNNAEAFAAVFGEAFDAIPGFVLEWMKHYLDSLKTPAAALPAAGEVIDPFTGEVQAAAPAPPSPSQQRTVERFAGYTGGAVHQPPPGASGGAPGGASVPGPFARPPARPIEPPPPAAPAPIDFRAGLAGHEAAAPAGHVPDGYTPVTEEDIPF